MRIAIKGLQQPHSSLDTATCEDALCCDAASGLFAVADGVSTAPFSGQWARALVRAFTSVPLLSDDPFEVEWWLRRAQRTFQQQIDAQQAPASDILREQAAEGSNATLASLRFWRVSSAEAEGRCLVFGDSCLLLGRAQPALAIESFPYQQASDFDQLPRCLPSRNFDREFHVGRHCPVPVQAGDTLILCTDAVALWILSAPTRDGDTVRGRFGRVAACRPGDWERFVADRRRAGMRDDDATALVLRLWADGVAAPEGADDGPASPLGSSNGLPPNVQAERRREYAQARAERELSVAARVIGDPACSGVSASDEERQLARAAASALLAITRTVRRGTVTPAEVGAVWQRHQGALRGDQARARLEAYLVEAGLIAPAVEERAQP